HRDLHSFPTRRSSDLHDRKTRAKLDDLAVPARGKAPIHPQYLARLIDEAAASDAIFTADVGSPTVWAARYFTMTEKRRLIGSFNHGSMANAIDRKSTRLNSSHVKISYAVFCLKKKKYIDM